MSKFEIKEPILNCSCLRVVNGGPLSGKSAAFVKRYNINPRFMLDDLVETSSGVNEMLQTNGTIRGRSLCPDGAVHAMAFMLGAIMAGQLQHTQRQPTLTEVMPEIEAIISAGYDHCVLMMKEQGMPKPSNGDKKNG